MRQGMRGTAIPLQLRCIIPTYLKVGVTVSPLEVRVAEQHRVPGGRARRPDRPLVRSVHIYLCRADPPRETAGAGDPVVVNHSQTVRMHVLRSN